MNIEQSNLAKSYLPLPKSSGSYGNIRSIVKSAANVADKVVSTVSPIDLNAVKDMQSLIDHQMKFQVELQKFTFLSNAERSKHEAKMAVIRNTRV